MIASGPNHQPKVWFARGDEATRNQLLIVRGRTHKAELLSELNFVSDQT